MSKPSVHKGINWDVQPLGKVSDSDLARELGCNPSTVARARTMRGIPSWRLARRLSFIQRGEFLEARTLVAEYLRRNPGVRETCVDAVATLIADRFDVKADNYIALDIIETILWNKVTGKRRIGGRVSVEPGSRGARKGKTRNR